MSNWTFNGKVFKEPKQDDFGFVYRITLPDGLYYIGKKNFWEYKKRKVGKRELALKGKSYFRKYKAKNGRWVYYDEEIAQTNWEDYFGSQKGNIIQDYIKKHGDKNIKREILKIVENKLNLTYWETKYQMCEDVLLDDNCINNNILGKFYRGRISE